MSQSTLMTNFIGRWVSKWFQIPSGWVNLAPWWRIPDIWIKNVGEKMGYSFSQHILMYKQSLGTLRCWCEAVIWITGVTNGWKEAFNQLFHGFGFFFSCVLIQECLCSQFPHLSVGFWVEDPSWQTGPRQDFPLYHQKIWWVQRALKDQFSAPQEPPQWTLKTQTVPVILARYRVWIHRCKPQMHSAFLLCWPHLKHFFCKICTKKLAVFMASQSKCLETLNYF